MKNIINNRNCLHRYFGEQIEKIDVSNYFTDFETLVDLGTSNFYDLLYSLGWRYGEEIPQEVTIHNIFQCVEEFEI